MNKGLALFFAFVGTALLAAISYFMAAGRPWMALLFGGISLLFIGAGFIIKAKSRKKES
ncbi:hypothetical protein RAC89_16670 [Paenibacillus sp. GD4]|jgi:uncharacterized membrane protein|uniref:hypothetical protein n=1 Tax=Paenibacillus TaxID=44249 RepID=UPI002542BA72|nr:MULTISPECIES: hypothetical protein [Paenibacillus]MDQ1912019.1 hypothetical protein [Paenibacillus sp. GD4]